MKYFIIYIVLINIICFIVYGIDKFLAKKNCFRISERCLFLFSLFGGALGAIIGMLLFRHKTKKFKFYLWNIIMLIIWIYLVFSFMKWSM